MPWITALNQWSGITCFFALSVTQACLQASAPDGSCERRSAGMPEHMTAFRSAGTNTGRHENYPVAIPTDRTTGKPSVLPV
ncbi:hypothetical protein M8998_05595 [Sphingobacterium sp. lm-10]|uniref:hypothetical protein n=1 Tax=Sphingobacterium sp. lm-10 TaxID=2944904 RepID=UPI002021A6F1|nr:hypothetical protein [Sphingobacterium sp. lm-10]MCL7987409.1 hypothetical protein [Sphingobacterium sp. lm-10]